MWLNAEFYGLFFYIKLGGSGANVKCKVSISQQFFSHSVSLQTYAIYIYALLGVNWRLGTLEASGIKDGEEGSATI